MKRGSLRLLWELLSYSEISTKLSLNKHLLNTYFVFDHGLSVGFILTNKTKVTLTLLELSQTIKIVAVTQSWSLCNSMGCSPPGSSVREIFWAKSWSGQPYPSLGNLPDPGSMQGQNLGLLHCRQILYYLSHQGSPKKPNHSK